MAPLSIRETKSNINYSIGRNFDESLAKETSSQSILGSSEDYMEGVKAFSKSDLQFSKESKAKEK